MCTHVHAHTHILTHSHAQNPAMGTDVSQRVHPTFLVQRGVGVQLKAQEAQVGHSISYSINPQPVVPLDTYLYPPTIHLLNLNPDYEQSRKLHKAQGELREEGANATTTRWTIQPHTKKNLSINCSLPSSSS